LTPVPARIRQAVGSRVAVSGALALAALVFACYAPSLPGGFIWDDDANVVDNPTIRSLRGLHYIWTEPRANQQFYPLTHSSFWLEYRAWGLWPTGFRLTNLLLHALVAILLWRSLRRLALPGAWVAAAIFAVHPLQVETAAWITERKNLLSAALCFAALLSYLGFARLDRRQPPEPGGAATDLDGGSRATFPWVALAWFVAALLSKTAVLTWPAAFLVLVWWRRGKIGWADLRPLVPLFAVGLLFGLLTAWLERRHVGAAGPAWDLGPADRLIVSGRALWFYATQIVFPFRLNFIYPRWSIDATAAWQYLYPAAALALPALLWRWRGRLGRGPLAGVACFGLTLAPALGFLDFYFQLYSFVQDHFQYLASACLIATLTALAAAGTRRLPAAARAAAVALLLLLLGALTWQRSQVFTSEEALWRSTLERNPAAWMARINLALVHERAGRLDEAETQLRQSLALEHPEHDRARYNLGRILERRGDAAGARTQHELALAANPQNADAHNNLGLLLAAAGRGAEALEHFRAAIAAEPHHFLARYNLALGLVERGEFFEAEGQLREALRTNPGHADALDFLGRLVGRQGRVEEAARFYRAALAADPERHEAHYNLGFALEQLGDLRGAEEHYRSAIRLAPSFADSHNNLAIVLYNQQRYAEAWAEILRYQAKGGTPHPGFLTALAAAQPRPAPGP